MNTCRFFITTLVILLSAASCASPEPDREDVSADNREILAVGETNVVDDEVVFTETTEPTPTLESTFTPTPEVIVYSGLITFSKGGDIYIMRPDGTNIQRLTETDDVIEINPKLSYDGKKILFASLIDSNIHVMDVDGRNRIQLTDGGGEHKMPAWSPDGRIIYVLEQDDKKSLVLTELGSNNFQVVFETSEENTFLYDPSFSPDGNQIVFSYKLDLYIINADGTGLTPVTSDGALNVSPSWSPDGNKIVFHAQKVFGRVDIYTINIDGSNETNITDTPEYDQSPSWSSSGERILFASSRDGGLYFYSMNPDGSQITQLTFDHGSDPNWQPEGGSFPIVIGNEYSPSDAESDEDALGVELVIHEISPIDGMEMALIPEGVFTMGSKEEDPFSEIDEYPIHEVYLSEYAIDRTPVTNEMFAKFLNEGPEITIKGQFAWFEASSSEAQIQLIDGYWQPVEGKENYPVIEVNWHGADAYCTWAGRRLPTEAEWEKAARGTDGRTYPWGDSKPTCDHSWFHACGNETVPVGEMPAGSSPYGVLDMAGNVWEWVADFYHADFYSDSPVNNPLAEGESAYVVRGGSWVNEFWGIRVAGRGSKIHHESFSNLGFRCAKSTNATWSQDESGQGEPIELWREFNVGDIVWDLAWSADSKFLLTKRYSSEIIVWDVQNETKWPPININGEYMSAYSGVWTEDGTKLAVHDNRKIAIMNAMASETFEVFETGSWIHDLSWSPDNQTLAAILGATEQVLIYDSETKEKSFIEEDELRPVMLTWSPDGKQLGINQNRWLHIWDFELNSFVVTYDAMFSPSWSPNGKWIAGESGTIITLINRNDGTEKFIYTNQFSGASGPPLLAWSPDGRFLASAGLSTVTLWDVKNDFIEVDTLTTRSEEIYCIAFSPDSRYLVAGDHDGNVLIWMIP